MYGLVKLCLMLNASHNCAIVSFANSFPLSDKIMFGAVCSRITVALSRSFVFVNCASISAFISDPSI